MRRWRARGTRSNLRRRVLRAGAFAFCHSQRRSVVMLHDEENRFLKTQISNKFSSAISLEANIEL